MRHNQHFGTEKQYSSIQTCQRRKLRFDWQRHGQPGLDAESHGRNSPATTVRKQEGRELQGQREQVKITHKKP